MDIDNPDGEIQQWLRSRYGGEPDERWRRRVGHYHSSEMGKCPRKTYWKFVDEVGGQPKGDFRYFEFGIWFEDKYEEVLNEKHGEDYVMQDVTITIHLDDEKEITGESDWTILREPYTGDPPEYEILADGTRLEHSDRGTREIGPDDDPIVKEVIETKTIGSLWYIKSGPKPPHLFQLMSYLRATGVDGRVTYMDRGIMTENELMGYLYRCDTEDSVPQSLHDRVDQAFHDDLETWDCRVTFDPYIWYRIQYNADVVHEAIIDAAGGRETVDDPTAIDLDEIEPMSDPVIDSMPETDPYDRSFECNFCSFTESCKQIGGSRWEDI